MNAILLAGIPGTGKTTVAKALIESLGGFQQFEECEPVQLVNCVRSKDFYIIGKYNDSEEVFQGTDRLSMAVSPNFQKFVSEVKPPQLFIEGDRLVGNKTIDFLLDQGYNIKVLVLEVSDNTRLERYKQRGSDQSEQFIRSKMTKVSNITGRIDLMMDDALDVVQNENADDLNAIVDTIKKHLEI